MAPAVKVDLERVMEAVQFDEMVGFCLACGHEQGPVEPDARRYECEECGERQVYGAEEILIMRAG
jgi:hypothetical protein